MLVSGGPAPECRRQAATQRIGAADPAGSVTLASGAAGRWLARRPGILVWQECFTGLVEIGLGVRLLLAGEGLSYRT
jgi:threonine/homoserine/homoserine lactone efflux protein